MGATQAAENHGDEWGLTWYLRWGIYSQGVIQAEAEVGHWFWDSWVWDPKLSNSKRKKNKKNMIYTAKTKHKDNIHKSKFNTINNIIFSQFDDSIISTCLEFVALVFFL